MSLIEIQGDLFAAEGLDAMAHGCNAVGVMGGGIAFVFARKWPAMYTAYADLCFAKSLGLGDVFPWVNEGDPVIFNLITQFDPGPDARLEAVEQSVSAMAKMAEDMGIRRIGLPRIGCGIGGLEWEDVRSALEPFAQGSLDLVVYEYNPRENS